MKIIYKLKYSLYYDEDGDSAEPYKWDDGWKLLAKKGQIAERFELTDEIREEYCVCDTMWKTIYVFKNGNYLLCQDEYSDDFTPINKGGNTVICQ